MKLRSTIIFNEITRQLYIEYTENKKEVSLMLILGAVFVCLIIVSFAYYLKNQCRGNCGKCPYYDECKKRLPENGNG